MPIYQSYNIKTKTWVKYHFTKDGFKVLDVKQRKPKIPFKNIPKKGKQIPIHIKLKGRDK